MTELPRDPIPGQPVSATWARQLLAYVRETTPLAGVGTSVSRTRNGTVIGLGGASGASTAKFGEHAPFEVRWYPKNGDRGEWQIYLPFGCATIGEKAYLPDRSMAEATDADGKKIFNWWRIEDPKDADAFISSDGSWRGVSWTVKVAFKAWPRMVATTDTSDAGPKDFGRGYREIPVATVSVYEWTSDGAKSTSHRVAQLVSTAQTITRETTGAFAIVYRTGGGDYERSATWKPYLVNQSVMLGRIQKVIEEDTDVSGKEAVCLKIEHSTKEFKVSITGEAEEIDADKTVIRLYDMKDGEVVADHRADIDKIPFYNG